MPAPYRHNSSRNVGHEQACSLPHRRSRDGYTKCGGERERTSCARFGRPPIRVLLDRPSTYHDDRYNPHSSPQLLDPGHKRRKLECRYKMSHRGHLGAGERRVVGRGQAAAEESAAVAAGVSPLCRVAVSRRRVKFLRCGVSQGCRARVDWGARRTQRRINHNGI